ncbi:MAG: DUF2461 domain-containing protein [Bacteroidetes bacterium]|nr:DUF2461 domain-containing protein [Bacteroidota bacterium]
MAYFSSDFNQFFRELAPNNHKDWFDENRKRYQHSIKEPFQDFVALALEALSIENPLIKEVLPKECIFRINRDVRFSKDKSPYKLRCSAIVGPGGKKNFSGESLYFEFGPEHVRFYAGAYEIEKENLQKLRESIALNGDEFKSLYTDPIFKNYFGEVRGEKNKILPKELKLAGENEPLIFNKQFYFFKQFPAEMVESDDLLNALKEAYKISRPMQQFFNKSLS